ncbi:MAG: beta-galactosidase [Spirochaetaceae bacterium]|nr:MAG: beta-galactosidase [Spirochaetaceae bacterium]
MIKIGAQYYRPPFPEKHNWNDDLAEMKAAGLNTLQMWVVWAWVEPTPGEFVFDDYDEIMEIARRVGLSVVLSTIAAIQPYWIHREVPGSEMVTATGRKVVSSNRCEAHYGLTPGGSISHPGVWERMAAFFSAVVNRYKDCEHLVGWDAWNELRWSVHAGGLVDYSDAAITEFRLWLDVKYGGLPGLNAAWKRRYPRWDDVLPGRVPDRTYTELMAFEHFITWRSDEHARKRYRLIKALDPNRPVTVHGAQPTILHGSDRFDGGPRGEPNTTLHRGNDWFLADHTDGIGVSSFPLWGGIEMADEEFSTRLDFLNAAAGDKTKWLSELQGGRSNIGFTVAQSVPAAAQQRWLWEGLSIGADAILFWCWRDEVFGRESTGFGLAGNDGLREQRFTGMRETAAVVERNQDILESYRPVQPRVGIFFSPQAYYLYWAQEGDALLPMDAIRGYATALLRRQIPYTIVEEEHLERLSELKILFMPRCLVLEPVTVAALTTFVEAGGTLVVESETGAFGANGIYRYPEQRSLAELTGVKETGRRRLGGTAIGLDVAGNRLTVAASQWVTPMARFGDTSADISGDGLVAITPRGAGRIVSLGTYLGDAYYRLGGADAESVRAEFETLLAILAVEAAVVPPVTVVKTTPTTSGTVVVRSGPTKDGTLVFVFPPKGTRTVRIRPADAPGSESSPGRRPRVGKKRRRVRSDEVRDIISGAEYRISRDGTILLEDSRIGFYVLHVPR